MGHCILEEMHHSIELAWRTHLFLFIPTYAKSAGCKFDLFKAL